MTTMDDDLIDDSGFELGLPTHAEMLKHYNRLLEAELETARSDLQRAHKTIAGLIVMYRDSSRELAALKIEHERLRWTLSEMYSRESESVTSKMTYAYGDYSNRTEEH
jgi:hypothetical protein